MQVTYLIGAGASHGAIPIVSEIPGKLEELISLLKHKGNWLDANSYFDDSRINNKYTKFQYQELLINDLQELSKLTNSTTNSVDQIALKKRGNTTGLGKIKALLSILFLWCQLENKFDRRYDKWIGNHILESQYRFRDDVVFLSWNYDHQFEMAYADYTNNKHIEWNTKNLNVISRHTKDPNIKPGFGIYKLNGTASGLDDTKKNELLLVDHYDYKVNIEMIENLVKLYTQMTLWGPEYFSISFGWEPPNQTFMNHVQRAASGTTVLIVIGYSFHPINTAIDRAILESMNGLKTVYVQDEKYETIIPRIKSTRRTSSRINIIPHPDTDAFMNVNDAPVD